MDGHIDLLAFDDDGALEETADAVGVSRADLLRRRRSAAARCSRAAR